MSVAIKIIIFISIPPPCPKQSEKTARAKSQTQMIHHVNNHMHPNAIMGNRKQRKAYVKIDVPLCPHVDRGNRLECYQFCE